MQKYSAQDFLYNENHSLGERIKRRLMAMMQTKKLPLLRIRVRSGNCREESKGRSLR